MGGNQAYYAEETSPLTEEDLATELVEGIMEISFTNAIGDAVYPVKAKLDDEKKNVILVDLSDGSSFHFMLSC